MSKFMNPALEAELGELRDAQAARQSHETLLNSMFTRRYQEIVQVTLPLNAAGGRSALECGERQWGQVVITKSSKVPKMVAKAVEDAERDLMRHAVRLATIGADLGLIRYDSARSGPVFASCPEEATLDAVVDRWNGRLTIEDDWGRERRKEETTAATEAVEAVWATPTPFIEQRANLAREIIWLGEQAADIANWVALARMREQELAEQNMRWVARRAERRAVAARMLSEVAAFREIVDQLDERFTELTAAQIREANEAAQVEAAALSDPELLVDTDTYLDEVTALGAAKPAGGTSQTGPK